MKWNFKKDNRLLVYPITVLIFTCLLFFAEQLRLSFRLLILLWSIIYFVHFYHLHLLKNLQISCKQLQYLAGKFYVNKNGEWIEVVLSNNSLVSYWLLALQWKIVNAKKNHFNRTYSSLILPSSLEEFEFKKLMNALQKKQHEN